MARTSVAAVQKVIRFRNTGGNPDALLSAITTANVFLTRVCGSSYNETLAADIALMAEIEKYLAAHFFQIFKPSRSYEMAKTVSQKIETKIDFSLRLTRHGQQAMLLDVSGKLALQDKLANTGGKVTTQINWLGTDRDEVEDE